MGAKGVLGSVEKRRKDLLDLGGTRLSLEGSLILYLEVTGGWGDLLCQ